MNRIMETENTTCPQAGMQPWNQLAAASKVLEDAARAAAAKLVEEAAQAAARRMTPG